MSRKIKIKRSPYDDALSGLSKLIKHVRGDHKRVIQDAIDAVWWIELEESETHKQAMK